jgi:hypothetical protein
MTAEKPSNGRVAGVSVSREGRVYVREIPPPPSDFGLESVAVWERLWRDQRQLADGDRLAVERLCRLEGEAACCGIASHGMVWC